MIEIDQEKVLVLWDAEYNLNKSLPCLHFEVYEEKYCLIAGRSVNPLGEKIKATFIEPESKWKYMGKGDIPEHLMIWDISFDEIVGRMQGVS